MPANPNVTALRALFRQFKGTALPPKGARTININVSDVVRGQCAADISQMDGVGLAYHDTKWVSVGPPLAGEIGALMRNKAVMVVIVLTGTTEEDSGQLYLRTPAGWRCAEAPGAAVAKFSHVVLNHIIDTCLDLQGADRPEGRVKPGAGPVMDDDGREFGPASKGATPIMFWTKEWNPTRFAGKAPREDLQADVISFLADYKESDGYKGTAQCRICGRRLGAADAYGTAGGQRYVWPSEAEHYIIEHAVWPPYLTKLAKQLAK